MFSFYYFQYIIRIIHGSVVPSFQNRFNGFISKSIEEEGPVVVEGESVRGLKENEKSRPRARRGEGQIREICAKDRVRKLFLEDRIRGSGPNLMCKKP